MSSRARTVTIAVIFGLVATLGAAVYINSLKAAVDESNIKKTVLVAATDVPAGTSLSEALSQGMFKAVEIPKKYVAAGAISGATGYKGGVTVAAIGRGEQVTSSRLRPAGQSEVVYRLAPDKIALAIPVDEITGVGGQIKTGDRVVVLATFSPGPGGSDVSRVLLSDIEVLAAGNQTGAASAATPAKKTISLAVTPAQAEKIVFAEEKGKVWVGLAGVRPDGLPATDGQTMESIFR